MNKPWEKYSQSDSPAPSSPWEKYQNPEQAAPQPQAQTQPQDDGGFMARANETAGMVNDRLTDLAGNFVRGTGSLIDYGAQGLGSAFDAVGIPRPETPDWMIAPSEALNIIGKEISDFAPDVEPKYTIDQALDNPSFGNIAGAIAQNAPAALADMAGIAANPIAYALSRNEETARERARNNNRGDDVQPTMSEFTAAMPATAASTLLDRLTLKKILGQADEASQLRGIDDLTPNTASDLAPVENIKDVLRESGKSGLREGGAEAVQEGGIEYAGQTVGTEQGWNYDEAVRAAAGGALVGGPTGAVVGGAAAGARMTPEQIQVEAERLGITPEEVERTYAETIGAGDMADVIAEQTGLTAPERETNPQVRAAREKELTEALSNETDVLRRQDLEGFDDDGQPVLREGAEPVRDPRGRQAQPESLGALLEAERVAADNGVTLPGDRLDLAAQDISRGMDPVAAVRSLAPETTEQAFRVSEARRNRRDTDVADGFTGGQDYQAAGRPRPEGSGESILLVDAQRGRDGKLVAGEQVTSLEEVRQGQTPGTAELLVEYGNGQQDWIDISRVTDVSQPDNPRMSQDFKQRAVEPPAGVGTEMAGSREATDRVATRQIQDPVTYAEPGPQDVTPAPRPDPAPDPGPRDGETFTQNPEAEKRGFDEVNRPPEPEGRGQNITDQREVADGNATTEGESEESTEVPDAGTSVGSDTQAENENETEATAETEAETSARETPSTTRPERGETEQEYDEVNRREEWEQMLEEEQSSTDGPKQQELDFEDIPDDKKESIGGVTMLSGVPTPEMIKKVFGPMFVGSKKEMDIWTTRAKDLIEDFRGYVPETNLRSTFSRMYNMTFGDLDRATRSLADRYDSKVLTAVADAFHHTAGGKSDGFDTQTLSVRRNQALNDYGSQFKRIADKLAEAGVRRNDKEMQDKIYRMLENPRMPRKGEVGKAVTEIETMFKDLLKYQQDRGIDVGYVEGFVPRWLDRNVVAKNRTGFLNKAAQAYKSMGSGPAEAKAQAAALYDAVVQGDEVALGQKKSGQQAGVDSTKSRKLTKEAADILATGGFWERDVERAVSSYLHSAIKRGEVADTEIAGIKLGDNAENWGEIRAKIQEEVPDITPDDLASLEEDVAYHTGLAQTGGNQAVRTASGYVRSIGALAILDRVAISAIPELIMGSVRGTTGNPVQDLISHGKSLQMLGTDIGKKALSAITGGTVGKNTDLQDAYDLAEYLGATAGDAISYSMQARMMGEEPANRAFTQVTDKFYRNVGLTQLNDYSRVNALRHANRFMTYLARDYARGGKSKNRTEVQFRDLGVKRGQEGAFAKWFGDNFADQPPTASRIEALRQNGGTDKAFADMYDRSVQTFVDQAIQRPDSSTRPRWADTPLGAMVFQLLNFTWAFQKNVINRAVRTAKNDELSKTDRALMSLGFMSGGIALTAMAAIGNSLRTASDEAAEEYLGGRPAASETTNRKVEKAISYSGLTGRLDPVLQLISGTRYQRSPAETMLGPTLGMASDGLANTLEIFTQNSENTNTAERSAYKSLHQLVLTPAMQVALAGVPLAGPAGRALVMGSSTFGVRSTREPFVSATAGEEDPKLQRRRLSQPLTGTFEEDKPKAKSRGGRSGSNRSGGRESGR